MLTNKEKNNLDRITALLDKMNDEELSKLTLSVYSKNIDPDMKAYGFLGVPVGFYAPVYLAEENGEIHFRTDRNANVKYLVFYIYQYNSDESTASRKRLERKIKKSTDKLKYYWNGRYKLGLDPSGFHLTIRRTTR